MSVWRDWIEEHWAGLGTVASIVGALAVAAILALAFNVITTHGQRRSPLLTDRPTQTMSPSTRTS